MALGLIGAGIGAAGSLLGGLLGKDAAEDASEAQIRMQQQAANELRGSREKSLGYFDPLVSAGMGALPAYQSGATLEGFGQNIGDIFSSGALQPLVDERMRSVDAAMGQAGLTRSGGALLEAARVPTELGFQLENQLYGRQGGLVGLGKNALANQANIDQAYSTNIANALIGQGSAAASGILGGQQALAGGITGAIEQGLAGFEDWWTQRDNVSAPTRPLSNMYDLSY